MKNTCILAVFAAATTLSYAQNGSQTRQVSLQSNGVVVHESAGNEGFATAPAPQQETRTLNDWTLPQCIDALRVIDEKIALLGNSEAARSEREKYLAQRVLVEQRKNDLTASSR